MNAEAVTPLGRIVDSTVGARISSTDHAGYTCNRSLVMVADPLGGQAESVRALRTHLVAQHVHEGRRALAVCAASAGVGCTFVAANLAVAFSQIGLNTLIIDGDLRRPALDQMIRPPAAVRGLRDCLTSSGANYNNVIEADVLPNLSVMYAGGAASNPQELLAGVRFKALLDFCLRDFDITIIDTPPANRCSDARLVGSVAGYSLIVVRRNLSMVGDVKTLADQLRADQVSVIGSVLTES
jgi:capsular exopolysaccharide synthesis family protein